MQVILIAPIAIKVAFMTFMGKQGRNQMSLGGAKPLSVIWVYLNALSVLKNTDFIVLSALG